MANKVRHTHKYFYDPNNDVWVCSGYNGCTHFRPKNMPNPVGVSSLCWGCEQPFVLTLRNLKEIHPKCTECTKVLSLEEVMPDFDEWQEYRARTQNFISYEEFNALRLRGMNKPVLRVVEKAEEPKDEIEVIEAHSADCAIYSGGDCDCGAS